MGKVYVVVVSLFVSLGSYITGYSIGSLNGLDRFPGFLESFGLVTPLSSNNTVSSLNDTDDCTDNLSDEARVIFGAMVSTTNIGGGFGNLFGGMVADRAGRKGALLISGILMILGGSVQGASFVAWIFIAGRFVAGLGYGLFYVSGPVYVAELAPKDIRGTCTSFIGPGLTLGILTGYISNIGFSTTDVGWRMSRLVTCILSSMFIVIMSFLPRSPRWLVLKGRESEAREVLEKTEPADEVDTTILEMKASLRSSDTSIVKAVRLMLKWKHIKKVLLGIALHVLTATSGNAILFYSADIFCSVGVLPFISTSVIGVLIFFGALFVTFFIDKFGRKTLLVYGALLMTLLGSAAATLVYFNESLQNEAVGYVIVSLVCLFAMVFSATIYIIPWIITSEIFPLEIRLVAVALATSVDWFSLYAYTQLFPLARNYLKTYGVLYLMAGTDLLAFVFYLLFLPETNGISLEEMEKLFEKPWLKRVNPVYYLRLGPLWPKGVKNNTIEPPSLEDQNSTGDQDRRNNGSITKPQNELCLDQKSEPSANVEDELWEQYWEDFDNELKETSV